MLYKYKYRIESNRLRKWDYRSVGMYFITICTKSMDHVFGYVNGGKMILSEIGNIVDKYWSDIPIHFPTIELDEYIVMPNHIHGIIIIPHLETSNCEIPPESIKMILSRPAKIISNQFMSKISPKKGSVSVIIRSFKSNCTKIVNQKYNPGRNLWQPRYYDNIIRTNNDLIRIRKYIINNPLKWELDRMYSGNVE